jgi:hypothetical protein
MFSRARRQKLRKAMLSAAMLAMALAAVAPAFAQDGIVNQEADQSGEVDDSVCSQVFNIAVQQYNAGDQSANASAAAGATAGEFGGRVLLRSLTPTLRTSPTWPASTSIR